MPEQDHFMEFQRVMIVDVLDEFVGGPLLLAVIFCEAELADWMAIECSLISFDHGLMAVHFETPFFPSRMRTAYPDSCPGGMSTIALSNASMIGSYNSSGGSSGVLISKPFL